MYGSFGSVYPSDSVIKERAVFERSPLCPDLIDAHQFQQYLDAYRIVVVKAWSPECNPCKIAEKKIHDLAEKLWTYVQHRYICFLSDNVTEKDSLHRPPKVNVVPTFFIYQNGRLTDMYTMLEYNEFQQKIEMLLTTMEPLPLSTDGPVPVDTLRA